MIGVDGGGTSCRVAIGTPQDGILARADGGPANVTSDANLAIKNILDAVGDAAKTAGLSQNDLGRATAHLGLAGVLSDADATRVANAMTFGSTTVTDDRVTTVAGALRGGDGFVVSIGTGTIIAAHRGGVSQFVGGWGFKVSDQGSGAWIGRAALEQMLLCHDGLTDMTPSIQTLFTHFNNDPYAVVAFATPATPHDFASLAPVVMSGAAQGDVWARSLMQDGADYLARGLTQLGVTAGGTICLTGGVGPHYAPYLPADLQGRIAEAKGSALDGAFALAKSAAGGS